MPWSRTSGPLEDSPSYLERGHRMTGREKLIEPNTIQVFGNCLLLVEGGGSAVHLARQDETGGRPAFDQYRFERAESRGFTGDVSTLRPPIWASKTLCGRTWISMAVTDETIAFDLWNEPAVHAPSCKRCLKILDRAFPPTEQSPAVKIIAELAADQVIDYGSAEIRGVPGDQTESLRREGKRAVRARGYKCQSWMRDDLVVLYSEEAYNAIPEDVKLDRQREALARMSDRLLGGQKPPPGETPWRLRWETWDV